MRPTWASRSRQPAIVFSAAPVATNQKPLHANASTTTSPIGTNTGHSRRRGADSGCRICFCSSNRSRKVQPSPLNPKPLNAAFPRTKVSAANRFVHSGGFGGSERKRPGKGHPCRALSHCHEEQEVLPRHQYRPFKKYS